MYLFEFLQLSYGLLQFSDSASVSTGTRKLTTVHRSWVHSRHPTGRLGLLNLCLRNPVRGPSTGHTLGEIRGHEDPLRRVHVSVYVGRHPTLSPYLVEGLYRRLNYNLKHPKELRQTIILEHEYPQFSTPGLHYK